MAWRETDHMTERMLFIAALKSKLYTMAAACEKFGISRPTGYKWLARFAEEGLRGLEERSRAPKSCPHRTGEDVEAALLAAREQHPSWGPRKLLAYLAKRKPGLALPAPSTVGDILKGAGLVKAGRRRRRRADRVRRKPEVPEKPNDLWTIDFKGEFRMGNGCYCYPLTVADRFSRFLPCCEGLPSTAHVGAQPALESVFREYGLPCQILSDNGGPFSSPAVGGLSRLAVWWIKLGIQPVLIEPGHPEQNGSHERMHRTLKAETARPPAKDLASQQERFDTFVRCYNEERPHEALGQRVPADLYEASPRAYPDRVAEIEYPGHYEVRSVRRKGEIKWQGRTLFVSEVLAGERVGLEETADGVWVLYFGPVQLGRFDERERRLQ